MEDVCARLSGFGFWCFKYHQAHNSSHQKGALRCDFNISIQDRGKPLGIRTELKHVAKFNSIRDCVEYEIQRQINILQAGGQVQEETRGIDFKQGTTFKLRDKEKGKDYRYMPEPDLPRILITPVRFVVSVLCNLQLIST